MDIDRWQRSEGGNGAFPPDGFPEGMTRQDVNNSSREMMAATKRFYDAPDFRNPFRNFSLVRTTGTNWIFVDGGGQVDAGEFLELGQRVKMAISTNPSVDFWEGWITAIGAYAAPNRTFTVEWLPAPDSKDIAGPTTATNCVMTVGPKELGRAAWYDTGSTAGTIPTVDDLEPHVFTPEGDLDVGAVQGLTADEISERSIRGRINANGGLNIWSRGVSFTSATTPANNDNQSIADNWTLLSDGNDRVNVARDASVPSGVPVRYSMKFTVSTGNFKHGAITFAELDDALDVGLPSTTKPLSASFWLRQGSVAGVKAVRAYLLNIKNATPSVDPVSVWGSGTEGSDLTWNAADWEQVGASLTIDLDAIGTAWTEFKIENRLMAAGGAGPIALAFAVDDALVASPASWHLAAVQINRGARALPFLPSPIALERARCERYFESSFDDEAGAYPSAIQGVANALAIRNVSAGNPMALSWQFRVPKFKVPTIQTFNPRVAGTGFDDNAASSIAVASTTQNRKQTTIISANASANTTYYLGVAAAAQIWGTG